MNNQFKRLSLALAGAALATLAGCGGGGGGGGAAPPPATTSVSSKVMDGVVRNALVCVDKNLNGACDAGETSGRTDATGNVTLAVPNADVGQYPIVAMIGADAEDMERPGQPIGQPYTMTTPVGAPGVVSPYSTMIANTMSTGASLAEASASVQAQLNLNVDPLADYTTDAARAAALAAGGANPATVARAIVVTTQAQITAVASTLGTPASNTVIITQADLTKLVQQKILQLLPTVLTAVNANPGLSGAALEAAVVAAVTPTLATPAQAAVVVAINQQQAIEAAAPVAAYVPLSGISLDTLNYTDANNWTSRVLSNSLSQATLDSNGNLRVNDRRGRASVGVIANWNFGTNPGDQANLHWTGSAWEPCGLNFEFTATVRDARGNNSSNYCNNYSRTASNRTGFDISGQTMAAVYDQIRTGGFTNITIANAAGALGAQVFPADSKLFYLTSTRLTSAIAYNPGSNSLVNKFPQATGATAACNGPNPGTQVTTLEELVANFPGIPCIYNSVETITNVNGTFSSGNPRAHWGSTTLAITTLGTAPLLATPSSYYTTNTLVRMAFTAGAPNEVTYYLCKQRETNGSTRECVAQPTKGTYTIHTLPDASRYMTFTNPPPETSALSNNRAFVERNGAVYYAYKDKLTVTSSARFNTQASVALLAKLGMPAIDPEVPLALTAASYQGTWDFRAANTPFAFNVGTRVVISGTNAVTCFDNSTGNATTCTNTVTNPLTGAFSGTNGNGGTNSGTLSFIAGTATGTFNDPNSIPPASGALVGVRR